MGLASALSTALTGLSAAETQIDVVGNNLANSQTVGFKASEAVFATQFLQTLSLGSGPTDASGGTNPRQTGLGVSVAEITPDFTQGTIEISSNPSDLAIQGDGFFMVQGAQGEVLYSRNGVFKTNSNNELVTVTGNRLLGFGVDEFFEIQSTQLTPLTIPVGTAAVAQATQNVFLEGALSPSGDVADAAEIIDSVILGDSVLPRPDIDNAASAAPPMLVEVAPQPNTTGVTLSQAAAGTSFVAGDQYEYQFTYLDDNGLESMRSEVPVTVTIGASGDSVTLDNLPPQIAGNEYDNLHIYRRKVGVAQGDAEFDYKLVGSAAVGGSFTDTNAAAGTGATLDSSSIDGNYSYLVTFGRAGIPESRPSEVAGPIIVTNGRVHLDNLPEIPTGPDIPAYDTIHIYRNLASDSSRFFHVASVPPGTDYTDARSDAEISDLGNPANREVDLDGPRISPATLLVNVVNRNQLDFEQVFKPGTLTFEAHKGGRALAKKDFEVTDTTTVQDLLEFMNDAVGIQNSPSGATNPIPGSINTTGTGAAILSAGATVTDDGKIRFVSNNGVDNALEIRLSAFQLKDANQQTTTPNLQFASVQEAKGQSATTDFLVFDSLGMPIDVRLTAVLESRDGSATTYRWFAESPDNDPLGEAVNISVGTGLVTFDGEGNLVSTTDTSVNVERRDVPSASPLTFQLDFTQMSGLAVAESRIQASRQDGSPPGTLSSFIVGEDGAVRGVFTNGVTRTLGQIRLARFSNAAGLEQRGQNMFAQGVNAGLPLEGNPGDNGIGTIVAGAVELSNTDIGQNLIDLVLATTQYRGNSRVISTAQQLLDELFNLRR